MLSSTLLFVLAPLSVMAESLLYFREAAGMSSLMKRAVCIQENPTCVSCFGEGSITCVDPSDCYNPTKGQTCCANGYYCDAGYYCVDGGSGCCPNGDSLEACSATASGSTIAPPASTSSGSAAVSVSSTITSTPASSSASASASSTVVIVPGSTTSTIASASGTGTYNASTSSTVSPPINAASSFLADMVLAMCFSVLSFLL
ncbi:Hypothetical protein R9X50_00175600 [Acrodontium crateriforme]|uniref:Uncharacterized protein n=1 Tax=Acrodontium crateriforme TaxID=150365 RepID=A0AAQ3M1A2_9PEZI|nr:Hypothetical protein R9X50_00175600 [Acrodontium crateriforme]